MGELQSEGKDLRRERSSAVVVVEEEGPRGALGREGGVLTSGQQMRRPAVSAKQPVLRK